MSEFVGSCLNTRILSILVIDGDSSSLVTHALHVRQAWSRTSPRHLTTARTTQDESILNGDTVGIHHTHVLSTQLNSRRPVADLSTTSVGRVGGGFNVGGPPDVRPLYSCSLDVYGSRRVSGNNSDSPQNMLILRENTFLASCVRKQWHHERVILRLHRQSILATQFLYCHALTGCLSHGSAF